MPIVFVATVVIALVTSIFSGGDRSVTTIYSTIDELTAVWEEDAAPVDRRIAIVFDAPGLRRLIDEQQTIMHTLDAVEINFETEVLLVAAMGAMPTDGYSIVISSVQVIKDQSDTSHVTMGLVAGSPDEDDDIVTQSFTYPVDTVVLARKDWPTGLLQQLEDGTVTIEVLDQDGRLWGPAFVYAGGLDDDLSNDLSELDDESAQPESGQSEDDG